MNRRLTLDISRLEREPLWPQSYLSQCALSMSDLDFTGACADHSRKLGQCDDLTTNERSLAKALDEWAEEMWG